MRPRISQKEAAYIVEILTAQTSKLKAKDERLEMLRTEFVLAKHELQNRFRSNYEIVAVIKYYYQVKAELEKIEWHCFSLYSVLSVHQKLINKYRQSLKA